MDRDIIQALVKAVELKDQSTAAHTWRVALYTMALAEALDVPRDRVELLMLGAVLHDVGKIDIPQAILSKPGRLTEDEQAVIRRHTVLGHERLLRMGEVEPVVLQIVRSHHERVDGSGYPDGLIGHAVPEPARAFAVIDSFDAMTSFRPYRPRVDAESARRALGEIQELAGVWYCDHAVQAFTRLFESGRLDWILRYFNDPVEVHGLPHLPDQDDLVAVTRQQVRPSVIAARRAGVD